MSGKSIPFGPRGSHKPNTQNIDEWINQGTEKTSALTKTVERTPTKRLSLDLTVSMHKDLMTYCVENETKAADLLRKLIANEIYK